MKHSVLEEHRRFREEFYATGIQSLTQRCKIVLTMKEKLRENNLNFLKGVPMIYGNFKLLVFTVSEKKIGGFTFVLPLVMWCMTIAI